MVVQVLILGAPGLSTFIDQVCLQIVTWDLHMFQCPGVCGRCGVVCWPQTWTFHGVSGGHFHTFVYIFLTSFGCPVEHILCVLISFFLLILPVPEPCLDTCQQMLWGSFSACYEIYLEGYYRIAASFRLWIWHLWWCSASLSGLALYNCWWMLIVSVRPWSLSSVLCLLWMQILDDRQTYCIWKGHPFCETTSRAWGPLWLSGEQLLMWYLTYHNPQPRFGQK
jgi:hypothetical protein